MEGNWFDNTPALERMFELAEKAVDTVAEIVRGDAQRRAPVQEGTLRGSGVVLQEGGLVPDLHAPEQVIERVVAFPIEYAAVQEERDDYVHPLGGEAHYLGNALKAHAIDLTVAIQKLGL